MSENVATWLIFNGKSGSHSEGLEAHIADRLAAAHHAPKRLLDCSDCDLPDAETLAGEGIGTLVVHGGDGTLNSVVANLRGWDGAILPLPGGTANLLCNRLHDDCDSDAILTQLGRGMLSRKQIDCVEGREWIALSEVLAGPGALWADVREDMREMRVLDIAEGSIDAIQTSREGPRVRVFAGSDEVGRESGYAGVRLSPVDGRVFIQAYRIESAGEFLEQGLAILSRDFRTGPHDELGSFEATTLRSTEDTGIELMIDGERFEGRAEEQFALAPLGVALLGSAA